MDGTVFQRTFNKKLVTVLAAGAVAAVGLGVSGTAAAIPAASEAEGASDVVTTGTAPGTNASAEVDVAAADSTIVTRTRSISDGVETITTTAVVTLRPETKRTVSLAGRCTGDRVLSPIPLVQTIDLVRGDGFGSLNFAPQPSAWTSNAHLTALDERSTFKMVLEVVCNERDDETGPGRV